MIYRKWSLLTGPAAILGGIVATVVVANYIFVEHFRAPKSPHRIGITTRQFPGSRRNLIIIATEGPQPSGLPQERKLHRLRLEPMPSFSRG